MNKLLITLNGNSFRSPPIWFMRQAGRYMPEFREIRKKNSDFINLCLNPSLASEITTQPIKRFNLDAAIIFSDILMVPYGLGQGIKFKKNFGPILNSLKLDEIVKKDSVDFVKKILPVYKAIKIVKKKIKEKPLIGFVGAPWTLLVYMINRESPKKKFNIKKILKDKFLINRLLIKLEEIICLHIEKQIEAGANIIQIFDSWAGLLPKKDLPSYCYVPTLKIVNYVKSLKVPVICFPKGIKNNYVDFCNIVNPNCISIDSEIDPRWARKELKKFVIQGGLDPNILLKNKENIKKSVENYLDIFEGHPYIFNLGHGILPQTKPQTIEYIINIIKNKK